MGTSRGKIWFVPSQSQHSVTCPSLLPRPHIGGGLHSLATTVLLTECSIAYSIGLLLILHIVPSNRMPSHIRHVSQLPSSIWIITAAPSSSSQHTTTSTGPPPSHRGLRCASCPEICVFSSAVC